MNESVPSCNVFFSYNSQDHNAVQAVAKSLRDRGLSVYLDRWYLVAGLSWYERLEQVLGDCPAVAVFLGSFGMGSWQQKETHVALQRQTRKTNLRVIPILLPGADPPLGFLSLNTWVDLRSGWEDPRALAVLEAAVLGQPPGADLQERVAMTLATVCPYRGLRSFREEDAPFFFGRKIFTDHLVETVERHNFVAVVGASGSGKSSVVQAGLVPHLRQTKAGRLWDIVRLVPGDRPIRALAAALHPLLEPDLSEVKRLAEVQELDGHLTEGRLLVRDVVARVLEKQPGTDRLLLIVDQWEELYTLCKEATIQRRFIDTLLEATETECLTVVLTLRVDFLGRVLDYRPLANRFEGARIDLATMNREEQTQAVELPARKVGLEFEEGLVKRILDDVDKEPGNLPLLEFALTQLWEKRSEIRLLHQTYQALGEVQGAIASHAEEVYQKLNLVEKALLPRLVIQLVHPGEGTEDTRRRATFTELGQASEPLLKLVKTLADARLIVTGRDETTEKEIIEIAHEALIRRWDRLQKWMNEDRDFRRWQERLRGTLRAYEATKQDKGALLRGALLVEARDWFSHRQVDLSPQERNFIQASLEADDRATRWRTRTAWLLAVAAGVFAMLFVIANGWYREAEKQRLEAEKNLEKAEENAKDAKDQKKEAEYQWGVAKENEKQAKEQTLIADSRRLAALSESEREKRLDRALLLAVAAWQTKDTYEARNSLLRALQTQPTLLSFLHTDEDSVFHLAFSPDKKTLVACYGFTGFTGVGVGVLLLWDVTTGKRQRLPLKVDQGKVTSVAFSPDGKYLAAGYSTYNVFNRGGVVLWDVADGKLIERQTLKVDQWNVTSVAFSPDSKNFAAGYLINNAFARGGAVLWDVADGKFIERQTLKVDQWNVTSVAFSPDSKNLAAGYLNFFNDRGGAVMWNVADGKLIEQQTFKSGQGKVTSVAFSPDGKTLAAGYLTSNAVGGGGVFLWDVADGKFMGRQTLKSGQGKVTSVAFSPDGKTLAAGYLTSNAVGGGGVFLWDVADGKLIERQTLKVDQWNVTSVAFSPDSKNLAAGYERGKGGGVMLWDVTGGKILERPLLKPDKGNVTSVAFSTDGKYLAAGFSEGPKGYVGLLLWGVADGKLLEGFPLKVDRRGIVISVAFSSDGKYLAAGYYDFNAVGGGVVLWDVADGKFKERQTLKVDQGNVTSVALSHDGKYLAAGYERGKGGGVMLWDVTGGKILVWSPPKVTKGRVTSVVFSPDGKTLAARVYDIQVGGGVVLWEVAAGKRLEGPPLKPDQGHVTHAAFSPDSKTLAASVNYNNGYGGVVLWEVAGVKRLEGPPLKVTKGDVTSVAFSPDGKTLAANRLGSVVLLSVSLHSWIQLAKRVANRNLSRAEWREYFPDRPEKYERIFKDLPEPPVETKLR